MIKSSTISSKEIKAVDIPYTATTFKTIAVGPDMLVLNPVQQGTGFYQRVGSRMVMKSLHLRGTIDIVNTTTTLNQALRLIVFYDRSANGAAPTIQNVIQSRDQAGAATTSIFSEINLDNRDRFVILRDIQISSPYSQWAANAL